MTGDGVALDVAHATFVHEQVNLDLLVGDRYAHCAEVDLQLMARRRLEAHCGRRLGEHFAAQVRHGAQAHCHAVLALQFLAHHIAVAAVLAEPLGQPVKVRRQPTRALRRLVGLPAALTQIAAHGVAAASPAHG